MSIFKIKLLKNEDLSICDLNPAYQKIKNDRI